MFSKIINLIKQKKEEEKEEKEDQQTLNKHERETNQSDGAWKGLQKQSKWVG